MGRENAFVLGGEPRRENLIPILFNLDFARRICYATVSTHRKGDFERIYVIEQNIWRFCSIRGRRDPGFFVSVGWPEGRPAPPLWRRKKIPKGRPARRVKGRRRSRRTAPGDGGARARREAPQGAAERSTPAKPRRPAGRSAAARRATGATATGGPETGANVRGIPLKACKRPSGRAQAAARPSAPRAV